jgi:hypothetical protein
MSELLRAAGLTELSFVWLFVKRTIAAIALKTPVYGISKKQNGQ